MKTLDLFCGVGGLSLGFQKMDFEIVGAIDNWKEAVETYNQNKKLFKHKATLHDLRDYNKLNFEKLFGKIECVIGGPPCQDFSSAGKRMEDKNADLTVVFGKILKKIKPRFFVMENVPRTKNSNSYLLVKKIFYDIGYSLSEVILDASLCGVPQRRKRFFCIGSLEGSEGFLNGHLEKNLSKKPKTLREFFKTKLNVEHYYRHPRSYARRGIFSVDEPSPTIRGVNRPIPKNYKIHSGDTFPEVHNLRPLTTLERSRIQTFPESFVWTGSKTQKEQLIGNAVPPELAQYVAKCLKDYIKSGEIGQFSLKLD